MGLRERCGRGWSRTFRELPEREADANRTGVAFVSVLFSLVVAKIADGAVEPVRAIFDDQGSFEEPGVSIAHHFVGLVLTVTSFVGYFTSKNGPQLRIKFFNLPLLQIFLDSAMVIVYFFVPVYAEGPGDDATARPEALLVSIAFGLYVAWDVLGWRLRRDPLSQLALGRLPQSEYGYRRWITLGAIALSWPTTAWLFLARPVLSPALVIAWDLGLVVLLLGFRIAKTMGDNEVRCRSEAPAHPMTKREVSLAPAHLSDWKRVVPSAVRNDIDLLAKIASTEYLRLGAEDRPAAERLHGVGAIEIRWTNECDLASLSDAGEAYLRMRPK